ncbi:c-type cytochrome [Thalassotalea sp. ND16A]|uniref:c-type cytochrome n=1 Tax=Thalassotalea sp. ND16A TaxID=1535422 RepID=UPI00051DFAF3|nr:cytochrome c [Thalassotalea sp. ND16A]KGJ99629.1 hypothetical protein ND16A_3729 [Thalassotalea sp. ND16A]
MDRFILSNFLQIMIIRCVALIGLFCSSVDAANQLTPSAGQILYRQGILSSGNQMTAIVAGDIAILGKQFNCQSCHGRSGMGAAEGKYVVPSIAGKLLFSGSHKRPAYDRKTLARVLREGIDSSGRLLDPLMPRFVLPDNDIEELAVYLEGLSAEPMPGLDDKVIRLATVISEDIDIEQRKAVVDVLSTYVKVINRQTRLESQRPNRGTKPEVKLPSLYREWILDIWTLKGDRQSWPAQLRNYYQTQPVFALMSGLTSGSWAPVGRFCENNKIPCLFPSTDLPDAEQNDFYTFHFSKGIKLEAELISEHISSQFVPKVRQEGSKTIQFYCDAIGARASEFLTSALAQQKLKTENISFDCQEPMPVSKLIAQLKKSPLSDIILWLAREKLNEITQLLPARNIYLSSTLLQRNLLGDFPLAKDSLLVAHPYKLPGKIDSAMRRFKVWAKLHGIKIRYPKLQAEAFFASFATSDALNHVRRYRLRDYLLEMLDHSPGVAVYLPHYPRPSLGPGQRFLTKGGYLLSLINGEPDIINAQWILPF